MYTPGHSRLISTGIFLPEQRISSRDLMEQIDSQNRFGLAPDWLERVTGIRERRVATPDIKPSDMAAAAARDAIERAQILPREIDAIIYAGVIKDLLEPATAHIVAHKIGAENAIALDVSNACLGFMSAMHLMDSLIATGQARRGLVVTGERGYAYTERAIRALTQAGSRERFDDLIAGLTLGDAGAAMIMGPKLDPESGFMGFVMHSQAEFYDLCTCANENDADPLITKVTQIVKETSKLVRPMYNELMGKLDWQNDSLKVYIPHQVGLKSIKIHSGLVNIPPERIPVTVDYLGNIISATIPLNIHLLAERKKFSSADRIYLSGTGSGICLSQSGLIWDAA